MNEDWNKTDIDIYCDLCLKASNGDEDAQRKIEELEKIAEDYTETIDTEY